MNVELDTHFQLFHAWHIEDKSARAFPGACQILQVCGRAECGDSMSSICLEI